MDANNPAASSAASGVQPLGTSGKPPGKKSSSPSSLSPSSASSFGSSPSPISPSTPPGILPSDSCDGPSIFSPSETPQPVSLSSSAAPSSSSASSVPPPLAANMSSLPKPSIRGFSKFNLQTTLQLMGCKSLHAFEITEIVFHWLNQSLMDAKKLKKKKEKKEAQKKAAASASASASASLSINGSSSSIISIPISPDLSSSAAQAQDISSSAFPSLTPPLHPQSNSTILKKLAQPIPISHFGSQIGCEESYVRTQPDLLEFRSLKKKIAADSRAKSQLKTAAGPAPFALGVSPPASASSQEPSPSLSMNHNIILPLAPPALSVSSSSSSSAPSSSSSPASAFSPVRRASVDASIHISEQKEENKATTKPKKQSSISLSLSSSSLSASASSSSSSSFPSSSVTPPSASSSSLSITPAAPAVSNQVAISGSLVYGTDLAELETPANYDSDMEFDPSIKSRRSAAAAAGSRQRSSSRSSAHVTAVASAAAAAAASAAVRNSASKPSSMVEGASMLSSSSTSVSSSSSFAPSENHLPQSSSIFSSLSAPSNALSASSVSASSASSSSSSASSSSILTSIAHVEERESFAVDDIFEEQTMVRPDAPMSPLTAQLRSNPPSALSSLRLHIHSKDCTTITISRSEFYEIVRLALAAYHYSRPEQIEDFKIACEFGEIKRPLIVLFGGTSGTGKSTLSSLLAARLGISTVLSTDSVRHMLRNFISKEKEPVLYSSTYHAGETLSSDPRFSHLSPEDLTIQGYEAQCKMVLEKLERLINMCQAKNEPLLVEGVHLLPDFVVELMRRHPNCIPFTVYISNETKHKERFAIRAKYMTLEPRNNKYVKYFRNIRSIQDHLVKSADKYKLPKVDNTNIDRSLASCHYAIFQCIKKMMRGEMLYDEATGSANIQCKKRPPFPWSSGVKLKPASSSSSSSSSSAMTAVSASAPAAAAAASSAPIPVKVTAPAESEQPISVAASPLPSSASLSSSLSAPSSTAAAAADASIEVQLVRSPPPISSSSSLSSSPASASSRGMSSLAPADACEARDVRYHQPSSGPEYATPGIQIPDAYHHGNRESIVPNGPPSIPSSPSNSAVSSPHLRPRSVPNSTPSSPIISSAHAPSLAAQAFAAVLSSPNARFVRPTSSSSLPRRNSSSSSSSSSHLVHPSHVHSSSCSHELQSPSASPVSSSCSSSPSASPSSSMHSTPSILSPMQSPASISSISSPANLDSLSPMQSLSHSHSRSRSGSGVSDSNSELHSILVPSLEGADKFRTIQVRVPLSSPPSPLPSSSASSSAEALSPSSSSSSVESAGKEEDELHTDGSIEAPFRDSRSLREHIRRRQMKFVSISDLPAAAAATALAAAAGFASEASTTEDELHDVDHDSPSVIDSHASDNRVSSESEEDDEDDKEISEKSIIRQRRLLESRIGYVISDDSDSATEGEGESNNAL